MRTFEHHNDELNLMVNAIREINHRLKATFDSDDYRLAAEYREDEIRIYPCHTRTILNPEEIMKKIKECDLDAILGVKEVNDQYRPYILIF